MTEENKDVTQDSSAAAEGTLTDGTAEGTAEADVSSGQSQPQAGSKTPQENLLAALHEERRKRKELEAILNSQTSPDTEIFTEEGKVLDRRVQALEQQIRESAETLALERAATANPILNEKASDFAEFRSTHKDYRLDDVVKLFLADQGVSSAPARKGLERKTTGQRAPATEGYTRAEIENLRRNNHAKYMDLITSGKIKWEDVKT